jgi:TPR repeat protein
MYANGEGVPNSDSEAAQWYRLAAEQRINIGPAIFANG